MRRNARLVTLLVLSVALGGASLAAPFQADPRQAFQEARSSGRPLLVEFHTTWCESCELMSRTTWRDPAVLELMQRYVPLAVDGERNPNLVSRYEVRAYPTIVIADPQGRTVLVLLGLQSPTRMREHLARVLDRWTELSSWVGEAAQSPPPAEALIELADFARERGAWGQAEELYRRALRLRGPPAPEASLRAALGLGRVLGATDRCREALKVLKRARSAAEEASLPPPDDLSVHAPECALQSR